MRLHDVIKFGAGAIAFYQRLKQMPGCVGIRDIAFDVDTLYVEPNSPAAALLRSRFRGLKPGSDERRLLRGSVPEDLP